MDADRFDALSRSLTRARSRRTALASLLGGALGLVALREVDAKKKRCPPCKKRKKGKCKKKKPDGTACPGGTCQGGRCLLTRCTPSCRGKVCGDDGCGGSCGSCGAVPCTNGACNCAGQPDLRDCGRGQQCSGDVCATPLVTCSHGLCFLNEHCCNGRCNTGEGSCLTSGPGESCQVDDDCSVSTRCVGFVCQTP
jgi:hypothetical protein